MKKYYKLSLVEADRYFNHHHTEVIPDGSTKEEASDIKVSIIIPTHRTTPDSKKDPIFLKNQISEAEKYLLEKMPKRDALSFIENMREAERLIDHSHNLESLVLYANKNFAAVVKLPVELNPEVLIGDHFDVRPIYKALQQRERYYIMTISQQKIRLLQARNDTLINEFDDENFPFENTDYYTKDEAKLAQDTFEENLIKEFYNTADKFLFYYITETPQPIILAGDVKAVSYFYEMMDDNRLVIARLPGNFDNTPTHVIVEHTCPIIADFIKNAQLEYMQDIDNAESAGIVAADFNDIYREASNGNAKILYIGNNFSLQGRIENDNLIIEKPEKEEPDSKELLLDIMEKVQDNGGNIIFMDDILLDKYEGMLLVKRY